MFHLFHRTLSFGKHRWRGAIPLVFILGAMLAVACGADPTPTPTTPPPTPTEAHDDDAHDHDAGPQYEAASGAKTVDGDPSDWAGVPALEVPMLSLDGQRSLTVSVQVTTDRETIYALVTIPDDYNATPGDHNGSGSFALLWAIDDGAGPHMGTDGVDWATSLGMVDIWHWEIDCEPGVVSGGIDRTEDGDDPACNLDDEYATTPFVREDDEGNNLLTGVYDHSARVSGEDADGNWYWEISRPLSSGDPQDAQFASGQTAKLAIAYWDADETADGWTDSGHLQSSDLGWIEVHLP